MKRRVAFKTLGCRLNQSETDSLYTDFYKAGYGGIWSAAKSVYDFIIDGGSRVMDFFSNWYKKVSSGFSKLIDFIKSKVDWISNAFDSIEPYLKHIIGDSAITVNANVAGSTGGAVATLPSTSALPSALSSSTTSEAYTDNSRTEINAPITIQQSPGMSSFDVAKEVTEQLGQQFSNVKSTGIKR